MMKLLFAFLGLALALDLNAPAINKDMIREINSINGNTWVAGVNPHFVNKTLGFAQRLCGTFLGGPRPAFKDIVPLDAIPTEFDPRKEWGDMCPVLKEVRDQGACGSCWAISAAEVMTDRHCLETKGKDAPELSAQDITSCCSDCGMGCNGGWPSSAFDYWQNTGVVTGGSHESDEGCFPYALPSCEHHTHGSKPDCGETQPTPDCTQSCEHELEWDTDKHFGSEVYSVPSTMSKIQTELMTNGPIDAAFTVYEDFLTYKKGVYQHKKGSQLGGHAVKMIGWGVEKGTPYWLIVNSWNEDWGDQGLFKILRGKGECGIENELVTGHAKTD